ncbi:MAG: PEP/pyruvate-binding domain-containing protein [Cyclobacteriaceae bacterium]
MTKFFLHLVLASMLFSVRAQTVYNGHVVDVVTGADLINAQVQWVGQDEATNTNTFGEFVLKKGTFGSDASPIRFFNNVLLWEGDKTIDLQIIGLDGKRLLQGTVGAGGTYLIPRLKPGLYILILSTDGHTLRHKIISDGKESIMADKKAFFHSAQLGQGQDTIRIEKEGYYPREVVMQQGSRAFDVALLKEVYGELDFFNELVNPIAFDLVSSTPSRTNLGDVRAVKIVYDRTADELYYINTKKHQLHYYFAEEVLDFKGGHFYFNQTQYRLNSERFLDLGSINYYEKIDKYVLQFVTATEMTCEDISRLTAKIKSTSYIGDRLYFFANETEWEACSGISKISSEELYQGQTYQGLNTTENYGYLTKVSAEELPTTFVSRRSIVLTDGIPNDLPVVAGIITSEFQTPLSHINVLSNSRGTPNMALRGAWQDPTLDALLDELVYLKVNPSTYEIRKATLGEANAFWQQHEPQEEVLLKKNATLDGLVDLTDADISFTDRVGGKAANFAELLKINSSGKPLPTPEGAFAIPFHYYDQHMERYGLTAFLSEILEQPHFQNDIAYREDMLAQLRDSIINSPIDLALVGLVRSQIEDFRNFSSYRFRSSTNAEDLEDFSGAGLYDSYSGKKDHSTKTIENAIKKVWASLWNWRAFEERSYFKIDHLSCAMGILVHRSFPDEDANGVLVTKNLYNSNPGFIVNVQHKEYSIVFPEPGIIHDQIILFTWSIHPREEFMIEYQTFSNIPEFAGQRVMLDEELFELGRYAKAIKDRYYYDLPQSCDCTYDQFGVDIEFKVDSQVSSRKVYVKQARIYH